MAKKQEVFFEKASKKINEVFIDMVDGSQETLATIKETQFEKIKLDSDGGINLKRGIVKDDGRVYIERRLFKRSNHPKVCIGDLSIPYVEEAFNKLSFEERLSHYVKGKRITFDQTLLTGEAISEETKELVNLQKKADKGNLTDSEKERLKDLTKKNLEKLGIKLK